MTNKRSATPTTAQVKFDARFYFIFDQVHKSEAADSIRDVSIDEISEIDQLRRMVMDVSEETPVFMIST